MGTPAGWTFKPGNGGMAITQADGSDRVKCWANVKPNPADYQVLGTGSCRSANVWTYPNHYLKTDSTSALTRSACVKQCNADEGCTHMEWGFNGNGERQCVIFSPGSVLTGWAFVPGNGGGAITQANHWSDVSKCFVKPKPVARLCQDAQDGYLHPKKTDPRICYKDHTWANYLTGYWGYEAVCGGAICEMEPGLALALTPQPYRDWWKGSCNVVQCEFPTTTTSTTTTVAMLCQNAQDGYLYPKKTNPKICYKDHTWASYLTGYWRKEAVC